MSIRSFLAISVFVFANQACNSNVNKAIRKVNMQASSNKNSNSYYNGLINRNELIIGFRGFNASGIKLSSVFYVMAFKDCIATAYRLEIPQIISNQTSMTIIDSIPVTKESAQKVLRIFRHSADWDLNYNDTENDSADDYCFNLTGKQCIVTDGLTYELSILTKTNSTLSKLYAPDRYEKVCCSGNVNRVKFLIIKNTMDNLFDKN